MESLRELKILSVGHTPMSHPQPFLEFSEWKVAYLTLMALEGSQFRWKGCGDIRTVIDILRPPQ